MIKLDRSITPLCLSPSTVALLTAQFVGDGSAVWNIDSLKEVLLLTSFGKCAYCECALGEESKYMEVDHFRDKVRNPNEVVAWDNLVPSCKRCNGAKGSHDVSLEPIVNPYLSDPRGHFAFKLYRFRAKTQLGRNTLDVLGLNDPEKLVRVRFEIGECIHRSIDAAKDKMASYKQNPNARVRNGLVSLLRVVLKECSPPASYAATSATVLHHDDDYAQLKVDMCSSGIWSSELEELDIESHALVLDCV